MASFATVRHHVITVTGIVYAGFIGPYKQLSGWDYLTNPIQHIIVPLAMVLAWFITGPRGGIDRGVILRSLVIPVAWVPFILIRGAITHTYPYGIFERGGAWLRGLADGHWFHTGFCAGVHLDFRRF